MLLLTNAKGVCGMNNQSLDNQIQFTELMGESVLSKLKFCGKGVMVYELAKIMRPEYAEIDDYSRVMDYTYIDAGESFKLGKYSIITWQCVVEGMAKTFIGDRCFVGPGTKILTSTYIFNGFYSSELLPDGAHQTRYGDIYIADDAYIGANCVIMPGVTLGEGTVVGANAFVNKDCEPWGIYVGNPAHKIGDRKKPSLEAQKIVGNLDWTEHFERYSPMV